MFFWYWLTRFILDNYYYYYYIV